MNLRSAAASFESTVRSGLSRLWQPTEPASQPPSRPSLLPKNYLVEFIAGTFGPASSGQGLTDHLESEQNVRRVANRTNLGVMAAQTLEETSKRKLEEVHVTRAVTSPVA